MGDKPYRLDHRCALCKLSKGSHLAVTLNCPMSRQAFTHFHPKNVFTPDPKWAPKTAQIWFGLEDLL